MLSVAEASVAQPRHASVLRITKLPNVITLLSRHLNDLEVKGLAALGVQSADPSFVRLTN